MTCLLHLDVAEASLPQWAAMHLLVPKTDSSIRVTTKLRALNGVTETCLYLTEDMRGVSGMASQEKSLVYIQFTEWVLLGRPGKYVKNTDSSENKAQNFCSTLTFFKSLKTHSEQSKEAKKQFWHTGDKKTCSSKWTISTLESELS